MSSFDESDAFEGASLAARAMAARPAPYLDGLNPEQRLAVETMDGPVLMLAGAGTGKTKALMARVAHLITTGRAGGDQILAVTFTNKAAKEMKDRLAKTPFDLKQPVRWLGTFHSISVKILRRHAELIGTDVEEGVIEGPSREVTLKSNFTILDTDDQLRLLKQLIRAEEIDDKRWPARMLAGIIDHWKNRAWGPDAIPAAEAGAYDGKGPAIYAQYQRRLIELNAVDFGDLLMHVVTIFQTHPDILARYQRWFKYILVDEYQDTNVAQYLWLRLLAGGHKNICCVGDDDQSIYGWRGAEVGNILRFEKDFPGAHVVRLEQNYRSTPHILAAASGVIAGNQGRLDKELWTEATEGEKVRLIGHWDGDEEARWIGEEIEAMQRGTRGLDALGLDSMAILVRASHQMRAFEDRFLTIGLPYRVIGGPRFYERLEIRDAMAYFRIVTSPTDDLAFERIVNTPKRGLGDKAQQTIQRIAHDKGVSLRQAARIAVDSGAIKGKGGTELGRLIDGLDRWGRMAGSADLSHMELAEIILDESGYTEMWQNDKTPEAPGRLENLKELVKALEAFENLTGFLEHVSLIMDNESGEDGEKVSIMTLHAAKGLEFPAVFLPGWEDGLFPSQRSMDESGTKGVEEERRLAYVGITRAEEICTISFAGNRRVFGQWQSSLPSRFIDELPEAHVEVLTPPGLYGGGYGAAGMESTIDARVADADVYNSPGWRRMQARASQRPTAQPSEARHAVIDMNAVSTHTVGERVFHDKFGYGEVRAIEGDKLEIAFEKAGVKKVVARFIVGAEDVPF
ncbi:MAG: UvrD-helicase domain-containing protein [Roseovarius sp.]